MRRATLSLILVVASGCAYGFEDENAVFACDETGDCAGDEICGNHVLAEKEAFSICTDGDRVPAIGLRVADDILNCPAFDPTSDPQTSATGDWTATVSWSNTSVSGNSTIAGADFGCAGSDNARGGGEVACCVGGPQEPNSAYRGRGSVLCFAPASALASATDADQLTLNLTLSYTVNSQSVGGTTHNGVVPSGGDAPLAWGEKRFADWLPILTASQDCP